MTRVAVAEYAVLFWRDGTLVWDDYLHHRQFALTPDSERVLRWFASWRELDSIAELGELPLGIARRLLEAQVLVAEGSAEHVEQQQMLAEWGTWGPSARYLHFAARTGSDVRFADVLDDELRSAAKASEQPAPAPAKSYPQHPMIPVPGDRPDSSAWRRPGLVDALFERRSVRQFTADPVSLDAVGTVARVATGPVEVIDHPQVGQVLLKTSPSAGARTPSSCTSTRTASTGSRRGSSTTRRCAAGWNGSATACPAPCWARRSASSRGCRTARRC